MLQLRAEGESGVFFGLQSMFYKYSLGFNRNAKQYVSDTEIKHIDLVCVRRDSAVFQLNVASEEDFLLTVSDEPLFWKKGPLTIARVELVMDEPLRKDLKLVGLMEDDDGQLKSEILLDQSHIFVPKKVLQQVWVELYASADTPSGVYTGKIRLYTHSMFEPEKMAEELTFTLKVLEDLLPEPKDYRFYLDLWQHNSNIARKYHVKLWSEEHFSILDHYLESLAQLGQKALTILISEIPWIGQSSYLDHAPSDLFEYSMVQIKRSKDGTFAYDFTAMDRYVQLGEKHGIRAEIEVFGLLNVWQDEPDFGVIAEGYPEAIRVRYFDENESRFRFMTDRNDVEDYIRALSLHWMSKGWMDRIRVLADEPADLRLFQMRVDALRSLIPLLQIKVAISHAEFIRHDINGIYDYVVISDCAAKEWDRIRELRGTIKGKLIYYVCCGPARPNTFLRSPSIEARVIPWLSEKFGYDGFLRWSYTCWPDRPLEKIAYRPSLFPAGDMSLVYPGSTGKPMVSLRYKWLQRGIRDFEFMQIRKANGQGDAVRKAMEKVLLFEHVREVYGDKPSDELYSFNPRDYESLYEST